jgi:hypothetical protein
MLDIISTWISILQGIVTIAALIIGAYVAWVGLNTWREQISAKDESELARRVLLDIYKTRDAINAMRVQEFMKLNGEQAKIIHEAALPNLEKALSNLDVDMLEVEGMWGEDAKGLLNLVHSYGGRVKSASWLYYSKSAKKLIPKDQLTSELFVKGPYPDKFAREQAEAISWVENFLRPKLKLKKEKAPRK